MTDDLLPEGFLFSQHSLSTFARCAHRFLLKYVDRQPWPVADGDDPVGTGAYLERGRVFHQWMVRRGLRLPMEAIVDSCGDEELRAWWRAAEGFPWHGLPPHGEPELAVVVPLGRYRLYARYDLLALGDDGEVVVVDWKTLQRRPKERTLRERMQTRVYLYSAVCAGEVLSEGARVDPDRTRMLYWFTNHPEEPGVVAYSRSAYERDREELTALVERIAGLGRDEFPSADDPRQCVGCHYRSLCRQGGDGAVEGGAPGWLEEELDLQLDLQDVPEVDY